MLIEFLKTKTSKEDLKIALNIITEFKDLESDEEWMAPFITWVRLEQLEEYLKFLVNGEELSEETKNELRRGQPPNAIEAWKDTLKRYIGENKEEKNEVP